MPIKFSLKHVLTATLLIGTLVLIVRFLGHLSFPESDYNFLGKDKRVKLDPGQSVTQIFKATRSGLDQVKVALGNTGKLPPGEEISILLKDPACEQILASGTISWLTEEPKIYYRFQFPRIPDSTGKVYCLAIVYRADEKRGDERPFITVSESKTFAHTSYYDESEQKTVIGRTLHIRPAYSNESLTRDLRELEHRLSQYKPRYAKGWVLTIGLIALLGSIGLGSFIVSTPENAQVSHPKK